MQKRERFTWYGYERAQGQKLLAVLIKTIGEKIRERIYWNSREESSLSPSSIENPKFSKWNLGVKPLSCESDVLSLIQESWRINFPYQIVCICPHIEVSKYCGCEARDCKFRIHHCDIYFLYYLSVYVVILSGFDVIPLVSAWAIFLGLITRERDKCPLFRRNKWFLLTLSANCGSQGVKSGDSGDLLRIESKRDSSLYFWTVQVKQ